MRLQDIAIVTNTPLDSDSVLLSKFKAHDRVQYDPKTDLYSYKHDFTFRSKPALLTEIQRSATKHGGGAGGIPVKALKESWKEAPAAIEELEKEGEVLVLRTLKDGSLKTVFWNEVNYLRSEYNDPVTGEPATAGINDNADDDEPLDPKTNPAGPPKIVEKEFVDLWHSLTVPNEVDLQKQLANEGLKLTSSTAGAPRGGAAGGKKRGGKRGGGPKQRQVRITNTHLKGEIDLSRDYFTGGLGGPPAKG
jgi:transcription initiation factor TFIIE subunit beta